MTVELVKEVLDGEFVPVNNPYLEWEKKTVKDAINYTNDDCKTVLTIACEELAELMQVIAKYIRNKGVKESLIEEMADVYNVVRFVNAACKVDIKIDEHVFPSLEEDDFRKAHINKYTLTEIFKILNEFQNKVLDYLINKKDTGLEECGNKVLDVLEILKITYNIENQDIFKIRNYKFKRMQQRMINKEKI